VAAAGPFWEAESEHQDYLEKYPDGYTCHFIRSFGRIGHCRTARRKLNRARARSFGRVTKHSDRLVPPFAMILCRKAYNSTGGSL
jgi:hypothetical protein